MPTLTYDVPKVLKLLEAEKEKIQKAENERPKRLAVARKEWRLAVVDFAKRLLHPKTGALTSDARFQAKAFNDEEDEGPCLERLGPPKFEDFFPERQERYHEKRREERISERILALEGYPEDKKLRMNEERFARYVRGEFLK